MTELKFKGPYISGKGKDYLKDFYQEKDTCIIYQLVTEELFPKKDKDFLLPKVYKYCNFSNANLLLLAFPSKVDFNNIVFLKNLFRSIYGIDIDTYENFDDLDTEIWGSIYFKGTVFSMFLKKYLSNTSYFIIPIPKTIGIKEIDQRFEYLTNQLFLNRIRGALRDAKIFE